MGWKGTLIEAYCKLVQNVMLLPFYALPTDQRNMARSSFYAKSTPIVPVDTHYGKIRFYTPSTKIAWRINTYHDKEPETLRWIDDMAPGDVLWDIGANVGTYALYAAKKGLSTLAFEPASSNFSILNRNIELNGLNDKVVAFCCGLDNKDYVGKLLMSSTEPGNALSLSAEADAESNELSVRSLPFSVAFSQGLGTYSVDSLASNTGIEFPNHIKIDVDGIEVRILEGAKRTLQEPRLKSLLVELDSADSETMEYVQTLMNEAGLRQKAAQQSEMSRNGRFATQCNFIFARS